MKILIVLAVLVVLVLVCDKYEDRLPAPIKILYGLWKKFAHVLGVIMSFLILTILWVVGFGVYAIVLKVITLPNRFRSKPNSYWIECEPTTLDSMKNQF